MRRSILALSLLLPACADDGGDGGDGSSSGGEIDDTGGSSGTAEYPQEDLGLASTYSGTLQGPTPGPIEIRYLGQDKIDVHATFIVDDVGIDATCVGSGKIGLDGGFELVAEDPYSDLEITIRGQLSKEAADGSFTECVTSFSGCKDGDWSASPV